MALAAPHSSWSLPVVKDPGTRREPPRLPMVAGELLVRLRPDFPACAHCLLEKGAGFKSVTGTSVLDQVRLKHGITRMDPVFGGVHAAEQRKTAQQRFASYQPSAIAHQPIEQTYLVRVDPKTDVLAVAADFRRDPNVVSAEPNYIYKAQGTEGSRQRAVGSELETVGSRQRAVGSGAGTAAGSSFSVPGSAFSIASTPPQDSLSRMGEGEGEGDTTTASSLPNDPFLNSSGSWGQDFPDLWGLFQIHAPEAWALSQGEGVIVAVVDTGIDITHPDLAANVWHNTAEIPGNGIDDDGNGFIDDVDGWDFTRTCVTYKGGVCITVKERGPDVNDDLGHGTHVAGTIAAVGDNGIGIIGVAPKATVMAVKGLDQSGSGSSQDLAEALVYAAENGAQVINTSWSGPPSDTIKVAIDYVTQTFDAVVVASVGNDAAPLEQGYYPANLASVIAVGATTHTDEAAPFSNFGGTLDLMAPGGGDPEPTTATSPDQSILSLLAKDSDFGRVCNEVCHDHPDDLGQTCETICEVAPEVIAEDYVRVAGTSFAAPHVSGVAALVRSRHPEFTRAQVQRVLVNTADDLGSAGWDRTFGYGRVNAVRAVAVDDSPVAQIFTPDNNGKLWERDFPFAVRGDAFSPGSALRAWRLSVRGEGQTHAREIAHGSEPVVNGVLATVKLGRLYRLYPGRRYVFELEVEDTTSAIATDSKTFLIPKPLFASIPIPDRFDEGGGDLMISADGTRLKVSHADRTTHDGTDWLFDSITRQLRMLPCGRFLAPDGRHASCFGTIPGIDASGLYDIDHNSSQLLPYEVLPGPMDEHGDRIAFTSADDPLGENPDGSSEVFLYDVSRGLLRQITHGPNLSRNGNEVDELQLSADGQRVVFRSLNELDPTVPAFGPGQAFVSDSLTGVIRQLTNRNDPSRNVERLSLSADGTRLAYQQAAPGTFEGIFLQEVGSGAVEHVLDSSLGFPNIPVLSGDGRILAFNAAADLDPRVGNEDLNFEVFVLDLATREITQVTDTIDGPLGEDAQAVDFRGDVVLIGGEGALNGLHLTPSVIRSVRQRHRNHPPTLDAPTELRAQEGRMLRTVLRASDQDGDPLTFYVERVPVYVPGSGSRLRDLANSQLIDHGDGTADLWFTPQPNETGQYPLRIAVFDEVGGVDIKDVTLIIEDSHPLGDANCDGRLDSQDIAAAVTALFDGTALVRCISADSDGDGTVRANDLVVILRELSG
jgi:subtilisin family serine protease